ncbi:MAG: NADH-quinone oxidoreductase subunit M [Isosphaeraceae bacterium]|nr:NADH-quinone oxidoreductase subunit M [Isosphaeraceae bacterium]
MSDDLLLSLLWFLPFVGAMVVLLLPKESDKAIKGVSLGITLATFVLAILAYRTYVSSPTASASMIERSQNNSVKAYEEGGLATEVFENVPGRTSGEKDLLVRRPWIPYFNIQYYLGIDGISLSLVLLTGLVSTLACLASFSIEKSIKGYFALFLMLLGSMMGVFMSLDLVLFYVFFEVMLLPMYFLIAVWGGENREYAAIKFLLYTLFGSVFILVAILALYFGGGDSSVPVMINGAEFKGHTFDVVLLTQAMSADVSWYGRSIQQLIFVMFFIGFCVKLPSFPFHTWLPDAHVQAPTPISMILAGVLLKIGGYGLVRLAWPLAPAGAYDWSYPVAALGVFSILYGALAAMAQTDFKKLVAYSSVSHMGYCTLGMAVMNIADPRYYAYGVNGCMFMMIAHGITSTGMFFLVGVIYERTHTRDLKKLGGLLNLMPLYGAITILIFFGSMGLPGLCGFVAEVFVVLASFNYSPVLAVLAAAAVILTAGYILWTLQRVLLGAPGEATHHHPLPELTVRETIIAIPLVAFTVILGVFPQSLMSWMSPSVDESVRMVAKAVNRSGSDTAKKLAVVPPVVRPTPADAAAGE